MRSPERSAPAIIDPKDTVVQEKFKSPGCAPRLLSAVISTQSKSITKTHAVTLGLKFAESFPFYGISLHSLMHRFPSYGSMFAVQDVFDLWNENSHAINSEVNIGDELIQIDSFATKNLSSSELKQIMDGDAGSLAHLQFRDLVTNQTYVIRAQRHFSQVLLTCERLHLMST